jgi:hypothetical protein
MSQLTPTKKERPNTTMAIIGFVVIVILVVWLAVQVVGFIPQAFSSLASITDGVFNDEEDLNLVAATTDSTVNAGDTFTVSWNNIPRSGTYTFAYTCAEGVSVDVVDNTRSTVTVACDESISLGDDITELEVTIASERRRFTDVRYTVSFIEQETTESLTASNNIITVVNPSIPQGDTVTTDEEAEIVEEESTEEDDVEIIDEPEEDEQDDEITEEEPETTEEEDEPEVVTPAPVIPTTRIVETVTYSTPVSDPNGFVDLAVEIVAVGHLDRNGNFIQRSTIDDDARGAFQFEVKNIGTKTSDSWDFEALLPSGLMYEAPRQNPLQPQERILFTLGFDSVGEDGQQRIAVTVDSNRDVQNTNNSFSRSVSIVR